jgi:translation initiation factor IF-2
LISAKQVHKTGPAGCNGPGATGAGAQAPGAASAAPLSPEQRQRSTRRAAQLPPDAPRPAAAAAGAARPPSGGGAPAAGAPTGRGAPWGRCQSLARGAVICPKAVPPQWAGRAELALDQYAAEARAALERASAAWDADAGGELRLPGGASGSAAGPGVAFGSAPAPGRRAASPQARGGGSAAGGARGSRQGGRPLSSAGGPGALAGCGGEGDGLEEDEDALLTQVLVVRAEAQAHVCARVRVRGCIRACVHCVRALRARAACKLARTQRRSACLTRGRRRPAPAPGP